MEDISKMLYWRCEVIFVNPRHWLTWPCSVVFSAVYNKSVILISKRVTLNAARYIYMSFYIKCTVAFTISLFAQICAIFMISSGRIVLRRSNICDKIMPLLARRPKWCAVSGLWYRNTSNEPAKGRNFLLCRKRTLLDWRKIWHTCILCVQKCCNSGKG